MARRKTSQRSAETPVQIFRPPEGPLWVVMTATDCIELLRLARIGAGATEISLPDPRRPKTKPRIKAFVLDDEAVTTLTASLNATSGVTEPVFAPEAAEEAAEEAADLAAYEEARARQEEAFPLELAERLVAGAHPIKVFRDYRGMTQAELARQVGLSPMYISQIETGRRGGSTKALRRIAAALDIDLADLVR